MQSATAKEAAAIAEHGGAEPLTIGYLLPNLEAGGTEQQVLTLCRRLDRTRFAPFLVTTAGGGALFEEFSKHLPVTVMGDERRGKRFRSTPWEHARALAFLVRVFRARRPDILHAFLPAANVLGPLAARMAGVRRVITSKRSLADYKERFPLLRHTESLGNRLADIILVNSDAVRRDVERSERNWGGKIRRIYNGVGTIEPWSEREAAEFRRREQIPADALVVICVSNFYDYKGHQDLVEAATRLVPAFPTLLFLMVGRDAGTLNATRDQVRRRGLEKAFRFLGSRTDVPDLLRASHLCVHPSHEEGFSNAILEAMAAGLPVVACNVGGNPEAVVHGETGLLVPARDPARLSSALEELLADPLRRSALGRAGRQRAARRHSLGAMVDEVESLYATATGHGGGESCVA